jgi:hypothetical protein
MCMIGVTFAQMPHISSTQTQKLPDIPIWLTILMLTMAVLYIVVRIKDYTESACTLNSQDMDYVALLDTTKAATAGIKDIVQTLGAKRGKRAPSCTKGGSGT